LRLRTIEHRLAAVRLSAADAAQATLSGVADRVSRLRAGIAVPVGAFKGADLQSLSELSDRLDTARAGVDRSLAQACAVRIARDAERIAAHVAEQRTARVHTEALRREAVERDLRAAAARPPRLKTRAMQR
jgi:hypothetical protein